MAMTIDSYIAGGQSGNNAMAQRRKQDADIWKTMLAQINATKPETMLGYGLGKLLRGAWDHKQRRAAQKETENKKHRAEVSSRAAANAGLAPASGLLGDGFDIARGFQVATGGNNPIAWNAYGEATRAQKPTAEAPVEATTTEYTLDPNQFSAVQVAQGTPVVAQQPLNLTERAAQEMDLSKWATNNIPLFYVRN